MKLRYYQQELQQLQVENMRLHKAQRDLADQIQKLKEDPNEIERIARKHYNFARPGDVIVNVPD
jgi:cell division protein FtsB